MRAAPATRAASGRLPDGAYYLAGYAVECALKACITRLNSQYDWPEKSFVTDCHTHDIMKLVRLAGIEPRRLAAVNANAALRQNWLVVKDWNEQATYERHTLVEAVGHNVDGVLTWIKAHW
jgi:hypothetical protein